jgi:predicted HTH transcriptional regulator
MSVPLRRRMLLVDLDQARLNELIANPAEGLNVEIKRWLDPDQPEGIAKIVRAALSIRNRNGGYLIIGFDDKTLQPDIVGAPKEVRASFHLDKMQRLISDFASEPFEIAVGFG